MPMFVFKTPELIWIAEGDDETQARESLIQTIRQEWVGEIAVAREVAVRHVTGERVPTAVRFIRTFPLSDMGVY